VEGHLEHGAVPRPSAGRGPYRVDVLHGREGLTALGSDWDAILASGPLGLPLHRHACVEAWLEAFRPDGRLHVLVARDALGRAVGMAPLLEERSGAATTLAAPANLQTPRVEWVLGQDAEGAVEAIWSALRDRLRWDVLDLRYLQRDGPTSLLVERHARRDHHPVGRYRAMRSPYLALGGARASKVTSTFAATLRRRMRQLQRRGTVSYRRIGGGEDAERGIEEFLALEASGWKGRAGSAIASDPRTAAFYRGVARAGAREGWLALRALDLDGRPVAMHLGLVNRGMYSVPKVAYDERFAACSPGQLLSREVVAECEAMRLAEADLIGPDARWKREWGPAYRDVDWLFVYRPGLAGTARYAAQRTRISAWVAGQLLTRKAREWALWRGR
jgi:CelD/BcsL family acetyltransferase involved in cellulose biosynthesis